MMVVMGIDPGFANTGFGVVRLAGAAEPIDGGVIEAPRRAARDAARRGSTPGRRADRLARAGAVALEDLYFGKNVRSAIAVGQARGVAMLAAAEAGAPASTTRRRR